MAGRFLLSRNVLDRYVVLLISHTRLFADFYRGAASSYGRRLLPVILAPALRSLSLSVPERQLAGDACGKMLLPSLLMYELDKIRVSFGGVEALAATTLSIPTGETLMLLGPSGSGKSTLLRCLIGLSPFEGTLRFRGEPVSDWTAVRRRLGYVIQEGGLFPHLTARGNVILAAREFGWDASRIDARAAELADLVGLDAAQLARFPAELSGGQRQRVAMMRALMLGPDVLLLDEPLSALDPVTRLRLAGELRDIFARLGMTVVMVTHSLREARFFGGRALLMRDGRVVQQGSIEALEAHPADDFVAEFLAAEAAL
jgi:osmoprotectant transport system ATP-binding protein